VFILQEEKYAHITAEEKDGVAKKVMEAKQYIADTEQKVKKTAKTDTSPVLVKGIDDYWRKFIAVPPSPI
jgi:hypothetical protein